MYNITQKDTKYEYHHKTNAIVDKTRPQHTIN